MTWYKCDACGSSVCWCHPSEDWGVAENCMYDVGVPVNWRKSSRPKPKQRKKKETTFEKTFDPMKGLVWVS